MKTSRIYILPISIVLLFAGCSKSDNGSTPPPLTPPIITPPSTTVPANCILSGISQVNSGTKAEFALTAIYDNNYNAKTISIYDSTTNESTFHADFEYVTADSITIGQYEYIRLDGNKRVVLFATKSDLDNPSEADDYKFQYTYNPQGYLIKKDMYINGSGLPNFSTLYTYTSNLLTNCLMTSVSSGNLKVLEADITYDYTINIKNWIYTFPDATIDNKFNTALNFGNHSAYPVKEIVTKIYNPVTGIILDIWSTNYGGYKVNSNGNVTYGEATGDFQEGVTVFYGKTYFYYNCH